MTNIRKPNVAGQFYPEATKSLSAIINKFLSEGHLEINTQPKAIIAPHAGYIYSGPIAATVYATLSKFRSTIKNIVLLGPAHRMYFSGIAATEVDFFETPLGLVQVSHDTDKILSLPVVHINEAAYNMEHSLEVQLPFLQAVLEKFTVIPLIVGDVHFNAVAQVLEKLWGGDETLIVVSSDLSHYLNYDAAQKLDKLTSNAIVNLEPENIKNDQACGRVAIQGLLKVAGQRHLTANVLDLRNSGDTAGSKDSVVGYGAYCFVIG